MVTGWLGSITTLSASAVSMLEQLELILRVVSLGLGVMVGALTLIITWRKARVKIAEREER